MGSHLFPLNTFLRPSLAKPLTAYVYKSVRSYSQVNHIRKSVEERAPSTAQVFKNIAEEKLREAEQGVASQTVGKAFDAMEEATLGDSKLESVKRRSEEHEKGADFRRRGNGEPEGAKAFANKA